MQEEVTTLIYIDAVLSREPELSEECVILHADYVVIGIIRYNILMEYMEQLHILGILGRMLQCFREINNLMVGLKCDIYLSAS